jgi:hypothetical protein
MPLKFKYKIPASRGILGLLFCVALAFGMSYLAYTNQKGLQAFRFITFSVGEASVIYWIFALVFAFASILFCVLLGRNFKGPISVVLDETSIIAPAASLKGELLSIPYKSIKEVIVHNVQHQQFVTINSSIGQARLMSIGFKTPEEFASFKQALAARTNG